MGPRKSYPYWNPYLVGVGIGILLVLCFLVTGRGLGAVGAFSSFVSNLVDAVSATHAQANPVFSEYLADRGNPMRNWVVYEIIGVVAGGLISGWLSGRLKLEVIRGPQITSRNRLYLAFFGGMLMAFAAKVARGCTSGLALSGGATLSVGAWAFMISVFIGGYLVASIFRRAWT